jgi:two-component system, cell cycle sensor histidine kinase and response regulator CckA
LELTGYEPDQLYGTPFALLLDEAPRSNLWGKLDQNSSVPKRVHTNVVLRRRDSATVRVDFESSPLLNGRGEVAYHIVILRNAVERQAIACHLENLQATIDTVQSVVCVGSWVAEQGDSRQMHCSRQMLEMFGVTAEELELDPAALFARFHPDDMERVTRTIRTAMLERRGFDIQHRIVLPSGEVRWMHARTTPSVASPGAPFRLVGVVFDITERVVARASLTVAEQRYQAAAEASQDGLLLWRSRRDPQGRLNDFVLIELNSRATKLLAKERGEILGRTLLELLPEMKSLGDFQKLVEVADTGNSYQATRRGRSIGLESSWIHWQAVSLGDGVALSMRDITQERDLASQLSQASRLESIGRLAVGIAHDFNNMLSAILGFGALARDAIPTSTKAHADIEQALKAAGRAAQLTRYLLAFGSRQALEPKAVDVGRSLTEFAPILTRLAGTEVELSLELESGLQQVWIDPCEFEQTIVNLVANAKDAMPNGGLLRIRAETALLQRGDIACQRGCPPGDYVCISVIDTGIGMDEATKARIFEPFFTTKGGAAGTGLGLASVYGFVKQSGGHISVDSEVGYGTAIKILFPEMTVARSHSSMPAPRISGAVTRGAETVLLVESDESVRTVALRILTLHGYVVIEANNATEASTLLKARPDGVDVLLTALRLPRVNGIELAKHVKSLSPGTAVVLMSGAADSCEIEDASERLGSHFVQKPFTADTLVAKVKDALLVSQRCLESPTYYEKW